MTYSDPAFRAWANMLRAPRFLDRDVLLAAGVIADDDDWRRWCDIGWLEYVLTASDAAAVALFGLVQGDLTRGTVG